MKRLFTMCMILTLAAGSLFASGKQEESPVIEVAHPVTDEGQIKVYEEVFQTIVDEYNAENGTSYTLKFTSGQDKDITNTRMSSNNKPDVLLLDSPADVIQYTKTGLLLDLTEYARNDQWESTLFDWAYDLAKVDGRVYTLPYGYEGMVLWYNKEIMNELGLNPDSIDTREEYEKALQLAAENDYIPVMLGSQDWPWAQEWYLSIMYSYTGRNLVKETIEGTDGYSWNSKPFQETVKLYKSWHDKGYLADGKSYVLTSDDAINAFTSDKALFKLEGTWAPYWMVPLDEEDRSKIGVMLHPAINDSVEPHMPLAVGGMWCVSADTKHKDLAAALLTGLLDQDIQDDFLKEGMDVAPMAVEESKFKGLLPTVEKMWTLVNDALAEGSFGYTTWAFYPPETRVYLYEGIVNVLEGDISFEDYLSEMQRLNQKELEQGFSPVIPTAN